MAKYRITRVTANNTAEIKVYSFDTDQPTRDAFENILKKVKPFTASITLGADFMHAVMVEGKLEGKAK